jgi:arylsulfatase A
VPFIARWPGHTPAGSVNKSLISFVDIVPTLTKLAGGKLPEKPMDGVDVWPVLSGKTASVDRDVLLYFGELWPQCSRRGKWKLHMARYNFIRVGGKKHSQGLTAVPLVRPELYNLEIDPGENHDVAPENPEIVRNMVARFERVVKTLPAEIQRAYAEVMAKKVEQNTEPASVPIVIP